MMNCMKIYLMDISVAVILLSPWGTRMGCPQKRNASSLGVGVERAWSSSV